MSTETRITAPVELLIDTTSAPPTLVLPRYIREGLLPDKRFIDVTADEPLLVQDPDGKLLVRLGAGESCRFTASVSHADEALVLAWTWELRKLS